MPTNDATSVAYPPLAPAVFVTGKGGVGKTTVAAGLALAAAEAEGEAVYVEFGDAAAGRRVLRDRPLGLEHVTLDPAHAVVRAAEPVFGSAALAKLALDNFALRPVIRAAPAIRELGVLELARRVVAEHPGKRVVFDMPATGHSVAWLKVARQGRELFERGPLYEVCSRIERELVSEGMASIVVVTLPERLVLLETLGLCDTLEDEVGLRVDRLIVNRVPAAPPPGILDEVASLTDGAFAEAAKSFGDLLRVRQTVREQVMHALEDTVARQPNGRDRPLTLLPLSTKAPNGAVAAEWLTNAGAT
ncbi:MAG: ArsA-related P-loop ATPase [Myxococcota bacterium]